MILHFWDREEDRSPVGAAACGTRIVLALSSDRESVQLALRSDGGEERILPMERRGDRFRAEFTAPEQSGLLFYRFLASGEATPPRQITVYEPCETPGWFKNALVYQIFPDRFAREAAYVPRQPEKRRGSYRFLVPDWDTPPFYPRDERQAVSAWPFWGGTLRGMEEKLDYLASLGVSCLYLNPIFEACSSHRYDTGDYERIDSLLGTEEDFGRLCERARERGIRILLDGVFSHTGVRGTVGVVVGDALTHLVQHFNGFGVVGQGFDSKGQSFNTSHSHGSFLHSLGSSVSEKLFSCCLFCFGENHPCQYSLN